MLIHLLKISGTGCMITEKGRNYLMYQADEKRYETMKYHRCGTPLKNYFYTHYIVD